MKTTHILSVAFIAHTVAACTAPVGLRQAPLATEEADSEPGAVVVEPSEAQPSELWQQAHADSVSVPTEQWLRIENLQTGAPLSELCMCEAGYHPVEQAACADTDDEGQMLTHWTPLDQVYRMFGTAGSEVSFIFEDYARSDNTNRLLRPIKVLTNDQLDDLYVEAGVELDHDHHTILARAHRADEPHNLAEGVRFELQPVDSVRTDSELASYVTDDGQLDTSLEQTTSAGHGLFLDVPPGVYKLYATLDGNDCGHATLWLDGLVDQYVAPEITCD